MILGPHETPLNFVRSIFSIARSLWYSPVVYLLVARLFF